MTRRLVVGARFGLRPLLYSVTGMGTAGVYLVRYSRRLDILLKGQVTSISSKSATNFFFDY